MKKLLFIFVFLSFFFYVDNASASVCDYAELARLKLHASNINISYEYKYDSSLDDVKFSIRFDNLKENIVIEDTNKNTYKYNGQSSIVLNNFDDGNKYKFTIYTDTTNCINRTLNIVYVNLPKYNSYYNNSICLSNKDYYMCQMWYQHDLTEKEFIKKVTDYKNSESEIIDEKNEDIITTLIDFIIEYYYYFIGSSVIIVLIIVFLRSREHEFDLNT